MFIVCVIIREKFTEENENIIVSSKEFILRSIALLFLCSLQTCCDLEKSTPFS